MKITTRFAPSPTGMLHIGGARTALFNFLYARKLNGRYLLRIEDTDKKRSSVEAKKAIIEGLKWLDLMPDEKPSYQSQTESRHVKAAHKLLAENKAYYCYASETELTQMRQKSRQEKKPMRYDGRWRNASASSAPKDIKPVIRFKAPLQGKTIIKDLVQGEVSINNQELDDMILLRSDGSPTYILAATVDDNDMGVTHVIRGDDHLNNAFRQQQLFQALGMKPPIWAHIPLLHGKDNTKLSKRHSAQGIAEWKNLGYLPEAICNYLLRLGWAHGNDEIISRIEAIKWFDIKDVKKAAARFDQDKLNWINAYYIRAMNDKDLSDKVQAKLNAEYGLKLTSQDKKRVLKGIKELKKRANVINQIAEQSLFYVMPVKADEKSTRLINKNKKILKESYELLKPQHREWKKDYIETLLRQHSHNQGIKLAELAQSLRAVLSGRLISPPLFQAMEILGHKECMKRLETILKI